MMVSVDADLTDTVIAIVRIGNHALAAPLRVDWAPACDDSLYARSRLFQPVCYSFAAELLKFR
jgi:hypothetical protein